MGYIYKITNKENGKIYIGKTTYTIEKRFSQHISASITNEKKVDYNYLIHKAIRKYGTKSFIIECIEEINEDKLSQREIYWINFYNSCILEEGSNGYNMTYGGEGHSKIDKKEVEEMWNNGYGSILIAKKLGHHSISIRNILSTIENYSNELDFIRNTGIKVYQYNSKGELVNSFLSIKDAAENIRVNPSCISKCCNGHKNSAGGYFWSFDDNANFIPQVLTTWHQYSILQFNLDGHLVAKYKSLSEAIRSMGKKQSKQIKECCEGKRETMYGYMWKYDNFVDELAVSARLKEANK